MKRNCWLNLRSRTLPSAIINTWAATARSKKWLASASVSFSCALIKKIRLKTAYSSAVALTWRRTHLRPLLRGSCAHCHFSLMKISCRRAWQLLPLKIWTRFPPTTVKTIKIKTRWTTWLSKLRPTQVRTTPTKVTWAVGLPVEEALQLPNNLSPMTIIWWALNSSSIWWGARHRRARIAILFLKGRRRTSHAFSSHPSLGIEAGELLYLILYNQWRDWMKNIL